LLCAEDPETAFVDRLRQLGADLNRVFLLPREQAFRFPSLTRLSPRPPPSSPSSTRTSPTSTRVWNERGRRTRRALQPLDALAQKHGCTELMVLMVRHLNKKEGQKSLYRGGGSIAFVAASRIALLAARLPRREGCGVLA
jgi:hypothetical protein